MRTHFERDRRGRQDLRQRGTRALPHVAQATDDLGQYLRSLTDMLGPRHDEQISARVGETRLLAESWDHLIVGVAIATKDAGVKSLSRGLRRVREGGRSPTMTADFCVT
jgi:hypothetical protein